MAGLLKPMAANTLVKAIKEEVGVPIHFHTHDSSGLGGVSFAASEAGADIADAAMDSFSGGTSQPCLGSIVEALRYTHKDTGLSQDAIREINTYWSAVRSDYAAFESGLQSPGIFIHGILWRQFTNLKSQARSMGLEEKWPEIANAYLDQCYVWGYSQSDTFVESSGGHGPSMVSRELLEMR